MNDVTHDEHCTYEKRKAEYDAYVAMHPNFCRRCGASGWTCYQYDPSPAGVSLASGYMEDCDICPYCLERGLCPVCGSDSIVWRNDDMNCHCTACGFDDEFASKTQAPPEPECYCWERATDAEWNAYCDAHVDDWLEQLYEDRQAADYDPFNDDLCQ